MTPENFAIFQIQSIIFENKAWQWNNENKQVENLFKQKFPSLVKEIIVALNDDKMNNAQKLTIISDYLNKTQLESSTEQSSNYDYNEDYKKMGEIIENYMKKVDVSSVKKIH